jgi:hypothetical protein
MSPQAEPAYPTARRDAPAALPGGRASFQQSRAAIAFALGLVVHACYRPDCGLDWIGLPALLTTLVLVLGQWARGKRSFWSLFLFGWLVAGPMSGKWLG